MNLKEVLSKSTLFLRQKQIDSARLDSEILIASALGWRRIDLYLKSEYPLTDSELCRCRDHIARRGRGEPAAYILGEKEFYGHLFKVSNVVLVPRPETEHLVDEVISFAKARPGPMRVVDLGVGSGCIGISIIKSLPDAQLLGLDISKQAIDCARLNATNLEVADRCQFLVADACGELSLSSSREFAQAVDVVVANPPYIAKGDTQVQPSVHDFEPHSALYSPEDGLYHIRQWVNLASKLLRVGGLLVMEFGFNQTKTVQEFIASGRGFGKSEIIKDYSGRDRVVRAIRQKEAANG